MDPAASDDGSENLRCLTRKPLSATIAGGFAVLDFGGDGRLDLFFAKWRPAAKAYAEAAKADPKQEKRLVRQSAHYCGPARVAMTWLLSLFVASLEQQYDGNAEFQFEYGDTLVCPDGAAAHLEWLLNSMVVDPSFMPAQSALGRALLELDRPAEAATPRDRGKLRSRAAVAVDAAPTPLLDAQRK